MTVTEAYDFIDLLLDKADQPYFTTVEKDKFLNLAISDFINMHYQKMTADEDSRRALAGFIVENKFTLNVNDMLVATTAYNNSYPAFSEIYDGTAADTSTGYFLEGNQYVLPQQHLYVLHMASTTYNRDEVINPSNGLIHIKIAATNIAHSYVKISDETSVKNKSVRDFNEDKNTDDPFNKSREGNNKSWYYKENRILFSDDKDIFSLNMKILILPTINQVFDFDDYTNILSSSNKALAEHYQKQIVEIAVNKMTQVDVGLMTSPA